MNPEYLVQMFQNIMTAAPGYAFRMALTQLCAPCDNILSSLEAMAQAINAMSMDECKASQALVNLGGNAIASLTGKKQQEGTGEGNWISDFFKTMQSGAESFTREMNELQNHQYCSGLQNVDADRWDRCLFMVNLSGSIWDKALKNEGSRIDQEFVDFARSAFGDLLITRPEDVKDGKTTYDPQYQMPCTNMNAQAIMRAFMGATVLKSQSVVKADVSSTSPDSGKDNSTLQGGGVAVEGDLLESDAFMPNRQVFKTNTDGQDRVTGFGECVRQQVPGNLRFYLRATAAIEEIDSVMSTDPTKDISAETITTISQSTIPVYQIINTLAYRAFLGKALTGKEKDALINLTAYGNIDFFMTEFVREAESILAKTYVQAVKTQGTNAIPPEAVKEAYVQITRNINVFRAELFNASGAILQDFHEVIKESTQFMELRERYMGIVKGKVSALDK